MDGERTRFDAGNRGDKYLRLLQRFFLRNQEAAKAGEAGSGGAKAASPGR